jgi:hypothetical protein
MKHKLAGLIIFTLLIGIAASGWFFTLLVDLSMLMVLGYAITFFMYRVLARRWKWMGVWGALLLPLNILMLWAGGILPYFNLLPGEQVYFYLIPTEFIGTSGNDFMWNGLILPWITRTVPLEMMPTYNYLLFNIWAITIWIAMPVTLVWACVLRGFPDSMLGEVPWYKVFFPGLFRMIISAVFVFGFIVSVTLLLVKIYS